MKYYLVIACFVLNGCNGLDRLAGKPQHSNSQYDTTPVYPSAPIAEPYATYDGLHYWNDGSTTRLFLIHWKDNVLNNEVVLEDDLKALAIPEK